MILSADDFGISPAVDEAIIRLVEKKRISSTGCMVAGTNPHLFRNLSSLKNLCADIDVGLHLVLTDITPLAEYSIKEGFVEKNGRLPSLKTLALKSYLRLLTQETVEKEILAQISEFERIFGCAPDFVDGHQHVQQLPVVRNAIVKSVKKFNKIKYVRIADLPTKWMWKTAQTLSARVAVENLALTLPGRRSASLFSKNHISHNRYLLGYYRHTTDVQFKNIFEKYISLNPATNDLFFCHPGYIDEHLKKVDTLVASRKDNLDFLLSDQFQNMCEKNLVCINRFQY